MNPHLIPFGCMNHPHPSISQKYLWLNHLTFLILSSEGGNLISPMNIYFCRMNLDHRQSAKDFSVNSWRIFEYSFMFALHFSQLSECTSSKQKNLIQGSNLHFWANILHLPVHASDGKDFVYTPSYTAKVSSSNSMRYNREKERRRSCHCWKMFFIGRSEKMA